MRLRKDRVYKAEVSFLQEEKWAKETQGIICVAFHGEHFRKDPQSLLPRSLKVLSTLHLQCHAVWPSSAAVLAFPLDCLLVVLQTLLALA